MAENIDKVFPEGQWGKDTDRDRYNHIKEVLDLYKAGKYDLRDVKWFIKNAIVNRIYISKDVESAWSNDKYWIEATNKRRQDIWKEIINESSLDSTFMDIRRFTKGYHFEHIVPADIFISRLIDLNNNDKFTFERYLQIKSKLNICIITETENKRLDENHFRTKMPSNVDFEKGNEFARYDDSAVNIAIFGRSKV